MQVREFVLIQHAIVTALLSLREAALQQNKCVWLEFHTFQEDALSVFENTYINLTFWLNTTACKHPYTVYRINVYTTTDVGSLEHEGRLVQVNGSCTVILRKSVHCISPSGPAAFYREMNRSHVGIQWMLTWKDEDTGELITITKGLKLNVFDPPSVTDLTVDGQMVNDTHLLNEGQAVNITCSFDKGNPPATFRLLDDKGNDLKVSENDEHLVYSLAPVRCNQTWPKVRCEATDSATNRSVAFLVKCPPRFAEMSPNIIYRKTDLVELNITAHTTSVNGCVLSPLLSTEGSGKHVNCSLRGNPPDLSLIFHIHKEDQGIEGRWTVIFNNEYGTASTTLQFDKLSHQKTDTLTAVIITGPLLGAFLIIAIVVWLVIQRHKGEKNDRAKGIQDINDISASVAREERRRSPMRFPENNKNYENEVYGSARNAARTPEMASTSGRTNTDQLIYGDLEFTTKQTSDLIIGNASKTEYADINVKAIVPPHLVIIKKKINRRNKG